MDMLAGEISEEVTALNYSRNQVRQIIEAKQTARCQVTDCLSSRYGKDVLKQSQRLVRRRQRVKAGEQGLAAKMKASERKLMMMMVSMKVTTCTGSS